MRLTRREFLRAAGAAALGGFSLDLFEDRGVRAGDAVVRRDGEGYVRSVDIWGVRAEVNGWDLDFIPLRELGGSQVRVENSVEGFPRQSVRLFYPAGGIFGGSGDSFKMKCVPDRANRLRFELFSGSQDTPDGSFEIPVRPRSEVIARGGVTVYYERGEDRGIANQVAETTEYINSLWSGGRHITGVTLKRDEKIVLMPGSYLDPTNPAYYRMLIEISSDPQREAWHEGMHAFYYSQPEAFKTGFSAHFSSLRKVAGLGEMDAAPAWSLNLEGNLVFSIFDESSYHGASGHPYDKPKELFASAVTVMKFFPREFLQKLGGLAAGDPAAAKVATGVCQEVIGAFGARAGEVFQREILQLAD